jgi:glucuronoarabinoxylan endo-1,4-beta-xylanase
MLEAKRLTVRKTTFSSLILVGGLVAWGCSSDSPGTPGAAAGAPGASGSSTNTTGGTTPGVAGSATNPTAGTGSSTGGSPATGTAGATGAAGTATGTAGATGAGGSNATAGAAGTGGSGTGGVSTTGPVTVQLGQERQTIEGFGINNTWADPMTDEDADAMFSPTTGLGLTILRVGMGSNGMVMSRNIPADITKAKARGVTTLIGSCWSPPGDWKTEHTYKDSAENDGGHVLPAKYAEWADRIVAFAKDNGLQAMSIANEPDFASCGLNEPCNGNYPTTLYTAKEMVDFVKVAGPKFKAAGVKLIAPEASEWLHQWSNDSATGSEPNKKNSSDPLKCGFPKGTMCAAGEGYDYGHALFADKDAWAAVDIMGVHQYDTQVAEPWPADVTEKKPVWQTEMSGVKWWKEQGPSSNIDNGIAVAGWLHSALTVGEASAWLWWWYRPLGTDDNEGLILKNGMDTKRHYTFGNYTRFVRPGYKRVDVSGAVPDGVLLSAYKSPTDGTVVIVAINQGAAAMVPITIAGGTAPAMLTPTVTSAADNLVAGAAVAVTGGMFTATLDSKTVTTFVGK